MTDKYEEFKEWFNHRPTDEDELDLVFAIGNLFKEFDEYCEEKHRKEEIIETIWGTLQENSIQLSYEIDGVHCKEHPAEAVYNKLKEKDMIK